jgi:hypothetical protein
VIPQRLIAFVGTAMSRRQGKSTLVLLLVFRVAMALRLSCAKRQMGNRAAVKPAETGKLALLAQR